MNAFLGVIATVVIWCVFMMTLGFIARVAYSLFCYGFGC
jgi:hypothetical protein